MTFIKKEMETDEMAQNVVVLAAKSGNISSISWTHMVEE